MPKRTPQTEEKSNSLENINQSVVMIGSNVEGNVLNQVLHNVPDDTDLKKLAEELALLRTAMKDYAQETDHFIAIGEVAHAEKAAQANDKTGLMQHLKNAGAWTLDVAVKIAVPLAVEALKMATGLK